MDWLYFLGCFEIIRGNGELLLGVIFLDVIVIFWIWFWKEIVFVFNDGVEFLRVCVVLFIGSSFLKVFWLFIEVMGMVFGLGILKKCFID